MFRLFSYNSPLNVVLFAVLIFALQTGWWLKSTQEEFFTHHTEPLSAISGRILGNLAWQRSLGVVLIFVAATILNSVVNENKLTGQRTYVTGAIFIALMSLFQNFSVISPHLIALILTVRVIQKMFLVYGTEKPYGKIFDLGWVSAVALFFYFPSFWLLIFSLTGITVLRPFVLREWGMVLLGFFAFCFTMFTWYFYNDSLNDFISHVVNLPNAHRSLPAITAQQTFAIFTVAIFVMLAVSFLPRVVFASLIHVRKFVSITLIIILLAALAFFLQTCYSFNHFMLLAPAISILISIYMHSIKSVFYAEVLFTFLISCPLIIQFLIN